MRLALLYMTSSNSASVKILVAASQVAKLWYELKVDDYGESVLQKILLAPRIFLASATSFWQRGNGKSVSFSIS